MSYQVTDAATGRTFLGKVLFFIFSPVQSAVGTSFHSISEFGSKYFSMARTNEENERLKKELAETKIQLANTIHEREENERLRKILQLSEVLPYRLVTGELVGLSAKRPIANSITVNRGSRQGIRVQVPVMTPAGIVGMTVETSPFASRVQLISDTSSSIGAMLKGTQAAGILAGTGEGFCVLRFLPLVAQVKPGDVVVTSGQDGVFPEGLPVGRVTRVLKESDLYISAEVAAFQNQSMLREVVFLLKSREALTETSQ
jgi:rod shape-determining protein MreC